MTLFEQLIKTRINCDICGGIMHPMYGCGIDYDRIVCAEKDCGAEITFSTTTEPEGRE